MGIQRRDVLGGDVFDCHRRCDQGCFEYLGDVGQKLTEIERLGRRNVRLVVNVGQAKDSERRHTPRKCTICRVIVLQKYVVKLSMRASSISKPLVKRHNLRK